MFSSSSKKSADSQSAVRRVTRKPEFVLINNVYDELVKLVDIYGITKVLLHLGHIANEKISKEFAFRIWSTVNSDTINLTEDKD